MSNTANDSINYLNTRISVTLCRILQSFNFDIVIKVHGLQHATKRIVKHAEMFTIYFLQELKFCNVDIFQTKTRRALPWRLRKYRGTARYRFKLSLVTFSTVRRSYKQSTQVWIPKNQRDHPRVCNSSAAVAVAPTLGSTVSKDINKSATIFSPRFRIIDDTTASNIIVDNAERAIVDGTLFSVISVSFAATRKNNPPATYVKRNLRTNFYWRNISLSTKNKRRRSIRLGRWIVKY